MTSEPIDACPKCTPGSPPHLPDRCTSHVDEDDGTVRPCKNRPRIGQKVCGFHGGGSPQAQRSAAMRVAHDQAMGEVGRLLERLKLDPAEVSYADVLAEQVTVAAGIAAVLQLQVAELDLSDLHGPDHLGDARPHVLMLMLREWTVEAARLSKMAIDAGVDERRVRLAEGRGQQIATVLSAFATWALARALELGLSETSVSLLRGEVPKALGRAITTTLTGEAAG